MKRAQVCGLLSCTGARENAAAYGCPLKVASVGYTSCADRDCRANPGPRSGDVK